MLIRSGKPYSIEYPTYDQIPDDLFLGAEIRDVSSGRPGTLVDTVPLLDDGDGLYYALFTPEPNKQYRVKKRLYQDEELTLIDTARAPDVEFLDSVDIADASDVASLVGADLDVTVLDNDQLEVTVEDNDLLEIEVKDD